MEASAPQPGSSRWEFGTRQVVYSAIGAALYGVLNWIFNSMPIPGATLISFRPSVVVPFFMGIVFGPGTGFFTGCIGNVLGDVLSGYGFFWGWDLGNGLLGLLPPLLFFRPDGLAKSSGGFVGVAIAVTVTSCVALAVPALIVDPFVLGNIDLRGGFITEWVPAVLGDTIIGVLLTPPLLRSWNAYRGRAGR